MTIGEMSDSPFIKGVGLAISIGAAGVGATGLVNAGLNSLTGEKRQPNDKIKVLLNFSSDASNMSSAQLKALLGSGGETEDEDKCQNKLMALFSQHDDYDERKSRNFMERLHNKNIEVGIKLKAWKTMTQMDIFEAFGAPGHLGVHAGLTFAYKGLADWFISVSVDLAAIPAKLIENEEIPENVAVSDASKNVPSKNAVVHELNVVDGINDEIWRYKGSVKISLIGIFNMIAKAMEAGAGRGNYSLGSNNCIHFKNDILASIEGFYDQKRLIPNKKSVTQFPLNL